MVVLAKLMAKAPDIGGYLTYVFLVEDPVQQALTKYVMCTQFPNWNHRTIEVGEEGYLDYVELHAGVTQWFDRTTNQMIYHQYNNNQFIRFIEKPEQINHEYTM